MLYHFQGLVYECLTLILVILFCCIDITAWPIFLFYTSLQENKSWTQDLFFIKNHTIPISVCWFFCNRIPFHTFYSILKAHNCNNLQNHVFTYLGKGYIDISFIVLHKEQDLLILPEHMRSIICCGFKLISFLFSNLYISLIFSSKSLKKEICIYWKWFI